MMLNLRAAASVLLIAMSVGGTASAQKSETFRGRRGSAARSVAPSLPGWLRDGEQPGPVIEAFIDELDWRHWASTVSSPRPQGAQLTILRRRVRAW